MKTIPVLDSFQNNQKIGEMTVDLAKLPKRHDFCFSLGYIGTPSSPDAPWELVAVAPVADPNYVAFVSEHGGGGEAVAWALINHCDNDHVHISIGPKNPETPEWRARIGDAYSVRPLVYGDTTPSTPPTPSAQHPDDAAVDRFAAAMKAKLAKKRAEGRGGWDDPGQCTVEYLSELLHGHVRKGDPVDVGNLAMMLHQRGSGIQPAPPSAPVVDAMEALRIAHGHLDMAALRVSHAKDAAKIEAALSGVSANVGRHWCFAAAEGLRPLVREMSADAGAIEGPKLPDLRWADRDGQRVLQQAVAMQRGLTHWIEWRDVPVVVDATDGEHHG